MVLSIKITNIKFTTLEFLVENIRENAVSTNSTILLLEAAELPAALEPTTTRNRTVAVFEVTTTKEASLFPVRTLGNELTVIDRASTVVTKDPVVLGRITVTTEPENRLVTVPLTSNELALDEIKDLVDGVENSSVTILVDGSNRKQVVHFLLLAWLA
jgi:hypothetical protein